MSEDVTTPQKADRLWPLPIIVGILPVVLFSWYEAVWREVPQLIFLENCKIELPLAGYCKLAFLLSSSMDAGSLVISGSLILITLFIRRRFKKPGFRRWVYAAIGTFILWVLVDILVSVLITTCGADIAASLNSR